MLQPKAEIKPDAKLPEWKPGGGGATNPVQRLLNRKAVQAKLAIGQPNDKYEQEADQVASQVMSMSAPADSSASVQRQLETNHPQQISQRAQSITPVIQTRIDPRLQMRQIDGNQASGDLESSLNASKGGGSSLSESVRGFMEPRFGADFSSVRVHTDNEAVQMNRELGAQAFTHGSDVYFGEGKSPGNNELTAHELTHVVQQTGTIQRFDSSEHKFMGDQGSKKMVELTPGYFVSFGDITAMAGDFFKDIKQMEDLAENDSKGKGTREEIEFVRIVKVHGHENKKESFSKAARDAVDERYNELALNNASHFTQPEGADKRTNTNNFGSYHHNHENAIKLAARAGAAKKSINEAMLQEAFASHFLTDAFSSGHILTERMSISAWWNPRVPMFFTNLKLFIAEEMAKYINDNTKIAGTFKTVQQLWETVRGIVEKKNLPPLELGDLLSGAVHDYDNEKGIVTEKHGTLVGDEQLRDKTGKSKIDKDTGKRSEHADNTEKQAIDALKKSIKEVEEAYKLGSTQSEEEVVAKLCKKGTYEVEKEWPKAEKEQKNDRPNWQHDSISELLEDPIIQKAITIFAKNKADELKEVITFDDVIKARTVVVDAKLQQQGFEKRIIKPLASKPIELIKKIINYTPGSATGELGGVGGHDTDDNAVDYWQVAKNKNAVPTLSLPQRKKLLKDVLDGVTIDKENQMVLDLLTTNDSQVKETIDHVGWRRVWDKLGGDDRKKFIRHCGPIYWKDESFNSKKLEVKFLVEGRTNDIAQETIIIILRTCTPAQVSAIDDQVGGLTGLAFDLTGQWDTEFKQMIAE